MKLDPFLTKASRLARSGKHEETIRLLEPEVNRYRGAFHYYYLLGAACLHSGDSGGALTYFRLANDANRRNPLAVLGLAVLHLRRGNTDRAIDFYLEVLETDPRNRIAKKAMKIIRKHAGAEGFSSWLLEKGKIHSLYPSIPFAGINKKEVLAIAGVFAAVCLVAYSVLVFARFFPNPLNPRGQREGASALILTQEERMAPVHIGGMYRYELTRSQSIELFERARTMFISHRDDAARVLLNRIIESNASDGLKNRARIMVSYLDTPTFESFNRRDNIAFGEVARDPVLYNGVHVIWQGRASNIVLEPSSTAFDFVIGARGTLEGFARVVFNRAISVNHERPIEVLGRIVTDEAGTGFRLEGVNFHQSALLDN